MKSMLTKLFGLTIMICCIGASKMNNYEGCFPNACGKKGEYCKSPSLKIWKEYCESTSLKGIPASGVYSGICFHEAANRDPFYPHYGVVLIDKINRKHHFGAEFAFFTEKNPFEHLDINKAKSKMPWFYAEDHQIEWNIDHARVLLNPKMDTYYQINYFIKESLDDNDKLFLLGYWKGSAYRIFCEVKRNK